jgi:hypothetical protein
MSWTDSNDFEGDRTERHDEGSGELLRARAREDQSLRACNV